MNRNLSYSKFSENEDHRLHDRAYSVTWKKTLYCECIARQWAVGAKQDSIGKCKCTGIFMPNPIADICLLKWILQENSILALRKTSLKLCLWCTFHTQLYSFDKKMNVNFFITTVFLMLHLLLGNLSLYLSKCPQPIKA